MSYNDRPKILAFDYGTGTWLLWALSSIDDSASLVFSELAKAYKENILEPLYSEATGRTPGDITITDVPQEGSFVKVRPQPNSWDHHLGGV